MAELKIGGSDVVKIMYGDQEIGGTTKLEPGTILYIAEPGSESFENAHLFSTTKKWENLNGISIAEASTSDINDHLSKVNISGDDFKNLDINKKYSLDGKMVTVSRSTVDGEYRLNILGYSAYNPIVITAL